MKDLKIPNHIAIILDGNGRWAKKRMMPRKAGHIKGAKTVEKTLRYANDLGVKYMTLYAFSTENWNRPSDEVEALMNLLRDYIKRCIKTSKEDNMIVKVIGDKKKLPKDIITEINALEKITKNNTGLHLQIAINYGGRDEIIRAVKKISNDVLNDKISIDKIDDTRFSKYLDTNKIPDPDLLIRTSGEERISNFLLWQLAYTEFYFTDILWPDFKKKDLVNAIEVYSSRKRKFGKTLEQLEER